MLQNFSQMWNVMLGRPVDGTAKVLDSLCHYLLCMQLQTRKGASCAQLFANPK